MENLQKIQVLLKTKKGLRLIDLDKGIYIEEIVNRTGEKKYILYYDTYFIEGSFNQLYISKNKDKVKILYELVVEQLFRCSVENINCNLNLEELIEEVELKLGKEDEE